MRALADYALNAGSSEEHGKLVEFGSMLPCTCDNICLTAGPG